MKFYIFIYVCANFIYGQHGGTLVSTQDLTARRSCVQFRHQAKVFLLGACVFPRVGVGFLRVLQLPLTVHLVGLG